jgi:O-antigen ligase
MVAAYAFSGYEYAWQSAAQILCPLVAGMAFSTYRMDALRLELIDKAMRAGYLVFLTVFAVTYVPYSLAGVSFSASSPGAISAVFFQSYFLARYLMAGRKAVDLLMYLSALAIPVIGLNRGPLAASVALAVFALMPISLARRVLIGGLGIAVGLVAFYSPRIQNKMFLSGKGTIRDLRWDNPDLYLTGRRAMWESIIQGCEEKPWFGHGGNADRTWLLSRGFSQYLPHNDWLRVRFNYGWVGVALYMATMIAQVAHGRRKLLVGDRKARALAAAGLSCFVPYAAVMFTDNVLIYCQFFTVPMMMLLGLSYSYAARRERHLRTARKLIRIQVAQEPAMADPT